MLAPNIVIPFDGLHANIPAGFSRDTTFDSKIPRHSNTGVGGTGGSDTHTHTTQNHQHSLNSHTHTVSFGDWTAPNADRVNDASNVGVATHGHNSASSSTTSSANSSSDNFTTGSGSTLPPYYSVIFIKSNGYKAVPANGIMYTQTSLSNLVLCDGNNGTPNLTDKILRGAGTGADAGTTGGTSNHTHSMNHSHASGASHTHTGTTGSRTLSNIRRNNQTPSWWQNVHKDHTHAYTTGATTASIDSYSGNSAGDAQIYPPFYTLKPYKNMSGVNQMVEVGAIAMTTEATLPIGWVLCDGNNGTPNLGTNFIKCHTTAGNTGGASTHTHPNHSHTHTSPSHTHSGTTNGVTTQTNDPDGGSNSSLQADMFHTHSLSAAGATATYANADIVFDAGSSIPAYLEVKYIMATQSALGGGSASVIDHFI